MNSIPLLICAAFCLPCGIVIGLCMARLYVHHSLRSRRHRTWMEAIRYYQSQQLNGRL